MKNYIKALTKYEEHCNSYVLLCNYCMLNDSSLIELYCEGKLNLPSFILLKKVRVYCEKLTNQDAELEILFANAITYSKVFYFKTIKLVKNSHLKPNHIEDIFEKELQPVGQALINKLVQIKARIALISLIQKNKTYNNYKTQDLFIQNILGSAVFNCALKINMYVLTDQFRVKSYMLIGMLILMIIINYYIVGNVSNTHIIFFNIMCLIIALFLSFGRSIRKFGIRDISGQNIAAYQYRKFFNNIANLDKHYLFAVENKGDSCRH